MSLNLYSVEDFFLIYRKKLLIRTCYITILVGLPIIFLSLKFESKRTAIQIVESQKLYISYLILNNDRFELQRLLNSIAMTDVIYKISIISEEENRTINSISLPGNAYFLNEENMKIKVLNGPEYNIKWSYKVSLMMLIWVLLTTFLWILSIAILMTYEFKKLSVIISRPLYEISEFFKNVSLIDTKLDMNKFPISKFLEIKILQEEFIEFFNRLRLAEKKVIDLAKKEVFDKLATQVAHDIRSPLSTINILIDEIALTNDRQVILKNSIKRINDIANELLESNRNYNQLNNTNGHEIHNDLNINKENIFIPIILEKLINEKKVQYSNLNEITLSLDVFRCENSYANINEAIFSRIISNLINNSIEAMPNKSGNVTLSLREHSKILIISIQDNGIGMTPETLEKLGQYGFSKNKENSNSGNGIGVAYAFQQIKSWNGKIDIFSKFGEGTLINISIPKVIQK